MRRVIRGEKREVVMKAIVVALVGLLGVGVAAADQVLATAPARASGTGTIICTVANISTKPVTVFTEIFDSNGAIPQESESLPLQGTQVTLAPNNAAATNSFEGAGWFCKFTITQGSKRDIRAQAIFWDLNGMGEYDMAIPAQ
jgi:hypothetical protein